MTDSERPTIPTELRFSSVAPAFETTQAMTLLPYGTDAPDADLTDLSATDGHFVSDVFEIERLAAELPPPRRRLLLAVARDLAKLGYE